MGDFVVERSTGGYVGEVVLNELDTDNRSCSFRIAIGSRAFGRGIGIEATRLGPCAIPGTY